MASWGWLLAVITSLSAADAFADAKTAIPHGLSWHCFQSRAKYNPSDRAAVCVRTADECETRRERSADGDMIEVGDCHEQAKASVLTYFDVMQDAWRFWALPSSEECTLTRTFLLRSRDNQRVSNCQLIGKTLPVPGRFGTDLLPPGEGWYCLPSEHDVQGCRRDEPSCKQLGKDPDTTTCVKQAKASVFTGRDRSGVRMALALATSTQCNRLRDIVALGWTEVSNCSVVGDTMRPTIERQVVPDGVGWSCYASKGRAGGGCARSLAECEELRELEIAHEPSECKKAAVAAGRSSDGMFYAYPTIAGCQRELQDEPSSSRCESIR